MIILNLINTHLYDCHNCIRAPSFLGILSKLIIHKMNRKVGRQSWGYNYKFFQHTYILRTRFAGHCRRGGPVDKIRFFFIDFFTKLLVRQLWRPRPDFCTRLPEGFFNILPSILQSGEEGRSTTTKSDSNLLVYPYNFFFTNNLDTLVQLEKSTSQFQLLLGFFNTKLYFVYL